MMYELRREFPIQRMAIVLGVSRMGYYSWRRRAEARRVKQKAEDRLIEQIAAIQQTHRKRYGSRRVCATLERGRVSVGRHRVSRLMRENGLTAKYPKPYRGTTKGAAVAEQNVLVTVGSLTEINQAWASDITYIRTREGFRYLTTIIDLWSRMIVGWAISKGMTAEETTISALTMAVERRRPAAGMIVHSDRGGQYRDTRYRKLLKDRKLRQSFGMSCFENATAESLFKTLKTELVRGQCYSGYEEVRSVLFSYMEIYYNRQRLHSSLGYQSPREFEDAPYRHGGENVA